MPEREESSRPEHEHQREDESRDEKGKLPRLVESAEHGGTREDAEGDPDRPRQEKGTPGATAVEAEDDRSREPAAEQR